jgi:hypothetical protein
MPESIFIIYENPVLLAITGKNVCPYALTDLTLRLESNGRVDI